MEEDDVYNDDNYDDDGNEVCKGNTDNIFNNNIHDPFIEDVNNNPILDDDTPKIGTERYYLNDHLKNAVGCVVKDDVDDNEVKDITITMSRMVLRIMQSKMLPIIMPRILLMTMHSKVKPITMSRIL